MSKKDPMSGDINDNIKIPKISSGLKEASVGGRVKTNWGQIKWTKKKILLAFILLGFPYAFAIVVSFINGIYLATIILVGVGILVALLVWFMRQIDKDEDF